MDLKFYNNVNTDVSDGFCDIGSDVNGNGEVRGGNEIELNYGTGGAWFWENKKWNMWQVNGESNTQISRDRDEYGEYSVNWLNLNIIEKEIEGLRKEYLIFDDIT